jgi:hypothetical protein
MAIVDDFLKAFVYFMDNGIPEKEAKELAESVTRTKVTDDETLKAFTPEIKKTADTTPKKLATKQERGDLTFVNTKISDPQKSKMVLQGLDGTTESIYSQFRLEQEAIKKGMIRDLSYIKNNNIALGAKDKDNLLYNIKIYNSLTKKVNELGGELKEPEKIFQDYKKVVSAPKTKLGTVTKDMQKSMDKIQKLIDEMEDIRSGKKAERERAEARLKFQGKGYGGSEPLYRTLARQFLVEQGNAGKIDLDPNVLKRLAENPGTIDAIKIFRHHYGDDAFDKLDEFLEYGMDFDLGPEYPGQKTFEDLGIVVKNKSKPGETIRHYDLPGEIDQEIKEIDELISRIEAGDSPFYTTKEAVVRGILDANSRRAELVKVRNDLVPEDTQKLAGDDLLESANIIKFPDDTDFAEGGIVSLT